MGRSRRETPFAAHFSPLLPLGHYGRIVLLLDYVRLSALYTKAAALSAIAIAPDKTALVVDARLSLVAVWQAPRTAGAFFATYSV